MYKQAKESDVLMLLEHFEHNLKNCLYSYIDLKKYNITNNNLKIYYNNDNCSFTAAVAYYNGLQIYCDGDDFLLSDTIKLIKEIKPSIISSTLNIIDALSASLDADFEIEKGYVDTIQSVKCNISDSDRICVANDSDYDEIAALICSDEGLGGHYKPDDLKNQLLTRKHENFGRNYIIRHDGKIVCHAATYAEIDNLAVISGVITAKDYRGQNLATDVVSKLCTDLLSEGKTTALFYYTKQAEALYKKIGFDNPSEWGKIVIKNNWEV